jgi:hypothetical protein
MAHLHKALEVLRPTDFTDVPTDEKEIETFMQHIFSTCQLLLDSVPEPPADSAGGRSRSNTASSIASNVSEISASSARSDPPVPEHASLQKEWGKPLKLSAKENPLGVGVFKLSGKDGRGAWFARRSIHKGLSFKKFKLGLEREFPETLKVQGGPGEGNIRGIGGEKRVERKHLDKTGCMEGRMVMEVFLRRKLIVFSVPPNCTISRTNNTERFCNSTSHFRQSLGS